MKQNLSIMINTLSFIFKDGRTGEHGAGASRAPSRSHPLGLSPRWVYPGPEGGAHKWSVTPALGFISIARSEKPTTREV